MEGTGAKDRKLVTMAEVGQAIGPGVSKYIIGQLIAAGDLKRVTIGARKHFITRASLEAYLERLLAAST